jgi:predicted amidohydrolase
MTQPNFSLALAFTILAGIVRAQGSQQPSSTESLTVASIQMEITDKLEPNLARIIRGIAEASEAGARIVIFPETALSGFERETIEQLDWQKLDDAIGSIARKAAEEKIYVFYGTATRSGGERPYNSAILIAPDGREITRYHKMAPEAWFEPGDHLELFEIDGFPATVMICHDERFPEIVRLPVLAGAQICFYLSYEINSLESAVRKADGYRAQLIARAVENGIWVCQANGIGPLKPAERVSLGQSRIIDPSGTVIAEAPALRDAMLIEKLNVSLARRGNAVETLRLPTLEAIWREGAKLVKKSGALN